MIPNIQQLEYRHQLSDMDVRNNFRLYSDSLIRFELHERHFAWVKAFQGVSLPKLTHFALTDTPQSFIKDDIVAFGKACPNITHLNLSGVSNLENDQLSFILAKLQKIKFLSVLRNTKLTNEFFTTLTNKVQELIGLEMGGKPNAFQQNISLDGVENLCTMAFSSALREVKFEYCSKIGTETIIKLA